MNPSLPYWLAAIHLPNIGPRKIFTWLEVFKTIENFFNTPANDLLAAGVPEKYIQDIRNPNWQAVEADLQWAQLDEHHIICLQDEAYPAQLKEITDPPLVLFVQGDLSILKTPQLAMVGSRHATIHGSRNAEEFAYCLAQAGLTITSGLAKGVDGYAHRGALAANGLTIGVAGTGIGNIYPASHKTLVRDMLTHSGAVISEFPRHVLPHPSNFPRRNRIIAGLSIGVLVIEAALQSGSLITARLALEQGREVFAIPGSIHQPLAKGCHYLIRQGAKLVETSADVLEELGGYRLMARSSGVPKDVLEPSLSKFLDQIEYEITSLDMILLRCGLTAGEVSSMLLTLELNGYIQSVPGGYIRLTVK